MSKVFTPARLAGVLGCVAFACIATNPVSSQERRGSRRPSTVMLEGREVVDGEVIFRYRAAAGAFERQRAELDVSSDEVEPIGRRGARRVRSRGLGTRAMLLALRNNPDVEFAEPNYILRLGAVPNDPSFGNLWGLFNSGQSVGGAAGVAGADIDAPGAWDLTTGSRANVVGVIDTGIDYNHPDLAANMWSAPRAFSVTIGGTVIHCAAGSHGYNAINNTCDPMDDHNHGTHVAGTIGAVGNNGVGVAGVNWVASMMGLKFLSASGSGSTSDAIKAIEFAIQAKAGLGADANVRILSNSWGGGGDSVALRNQIESANTADMLFVAAAGNDATNIDTWPHYPSSYTNANVVSVASSTHRDARSSFSNYGAVGVDLAAPGSSILSTITNNRYASYNGTSMATPHVSGAAALVLARCSGISTAQLKNAILSTVDPVASMLGITATGGRLNANAAVRSCAPPTVAVNGQAGPVTVAPGSTVTVHVANGRGFRSDFVLMVPAGSPAQAWGAYLYLSGTRTRPATGMTSATVSFVAPSAGGNYEFRFFQNDTFTLLATSPLLTVTPAISAVARVSVNGGSSPATVAVGSVINVGVTNGPGFISDWVMMVPVGSPAQTGGPYMYLSGTRTRPVTGRTSASLLFTAPTAAGAFEFRFYQNDSFTLIATSPAVTVTGSASPAPAIRLNGGTAPIAVSGGSTVTLSVEYGPGFVSDWMMMVPAASPAQTSGPYFYLSGTRTRPTSGMTSASLPYTMPAAGGAFEFRFYRNDTFTLLATSAVVTVTSAAPALMLNGGAVPITVPAGATLNVAVANGPGFQSDWVMLVPAGSPAGTSGDYKYLSGSRTRPAGGLTNATVAFVAPAAGGTFVVRFYQNDSWTLLATSSAITVTP